MFVNANYAQRLGLHYDFEIFDGKCGGQSAAPLASEIRQRMNTSRDRRRFCVVVIGDDLAVEISSRETT